MQNAHDQEVELFGKIHELLRVVLVALVDAEGAGGQRFVLVRVVGEGGDALLESAEVHVAAFALEDAVEAVLKAFDAGELVRRERGCGFAGDGGVCCSGDVVHDHHGG